jgi:transcriptional regulator with XRE-family HTH domain
VGDRVDRGTGRDSQTRRHARSVGGVDPRNEIREFLTSRRARITPEQAGVPVYGSNRRVAGLRREEVAVLAGISVEYYTRLERGNASGVSDSVLEGLARALQLDEAERAHLFHLVRTTNPVAPARRRPAQERVRPNVQRILDAITDTPAFVRNARLDILAANRLGHAFYSELFADPARPVNSARFLFLNARATEFFVDWDTIADDAVGILRAEAGRDPYDRRLSDLIGELSTRSTEFRVRWAAHNVKLHRTGVKRFRHPLVGELILDFEALELPGDPGQSMLVYTAEPASPTRERLDLLGSWTSTPRHLAADQVPEHP